MAGIDFANGTFGVFCKADGLTVVKLRAEGQDKDGNKIAVERAVTWENAKTLYFNHAHTCKDRDNLWIWYLVPGGSWKPIKANHEKGEFEV